MKRLRRRLAAWLLTADDHDIVMEAIDSYKYALDRRNVTRSYSEASDTTDITALQIDLLKKRK